MHLSTVRAQLLALTWLSSQISLALLFPLGEHLGATCVSQRSSTVVLVVRRSAVPILVTRPDDGPHTEGPWTGPLANVTSLAANRICILPCARPRALLCAVAVSEGNSVRSAQVIVWAWRNAGRVCWRPLFLCLSQLRQTPR